MACHPDRITGIHATIKMTERYAKLAQGHIAKTGNTAREMWKLTEPEAGNTKKQAGS
jgi:hypothetical protein